MCNEIKANLYLGYFLMKTHSVTLLCAALVGLAACSSEEPEQKAITENLRKAGTPIFGTWQISANGTCNPAINGKSVFIYQDKIDQVLAGNRESFLSEMKIFTSSQYLMLEGIYGQAQDNYKRQLAYFDKGDNLEFAGYIVDNKLITRNEILESYNSDGNAKSRMSNMDFAYCNLELPQEPE